MTILFALAFGFNCESRRQHGRQRTKIQAAPNLNPPQPRPTPRMDSKISTTRPPTFAKTETAVVPRIPQEIIDEILGHLANDSAVTSLRSCSLVSKSWVPPCRRHLFRFVTFDLRNVDRWLKTFPRPEESPAHYIGELCARFGVRDCVPEGFFEVTPWFTNVEKVSLLGFGGLSPRVPSLWGLPPTVTSLTIKTGVFTLVQIRDFLARLPNLNDLSLSGYFSAGVVPLGIGTVLRGRFGGRLQLLRGPGHGAITNMLLEIPTGLCFTEIEIRCKREFLLSTMRLAEACSKTLVKFLYAITFYGKSTLTSGPASSSVRTNTSPQCRLPGGSRAVLRLFQIPKHPGSGI